MAFALALAVTDAPVAEQDDVAMCAAASAAPAAAFAYWANAAA